MTAGVSRAGRSICSDLEGAAVDGQAFAVTVAGYVGLPAVIASGVAGPSCDASISVREAITGIVAPYLRGYFCGHVPNNTKSRHIPFKFDN